jgi:hypothetical protein
MLLLRKQGFNRQSVAQHRLHHTPLSTLSSVLLLTFPRHLIPTSSLPSSSSPQNPRPCCSLAFHLLGASQRGWHRREVTLLLPRVKSCSWQQTGDWYQALSSSLYFLLFAFLLHLIPSIQFVIGGPFLLLSQTLPLSAVDIQRSFLTACRREITSLREASSPSYTRWIWRHFLIRMTALQQDSRN